MQSTEWLGQAADLIAQKRLELEAKGIPDGTIDGAISRAMGSAERTCEKFSADIRDQAYVQLLRAELEQAESWALGVGNFINGSDA